MFCFYFVAQCHVGYANVSEFPTFVQIVCVFFTRDSSFFSFEAVSTASVLRFAAILIVEAFVFVFCLRHETRRLCWLLLLF